MPASNRQTIRDLRRNSRSAVLQRLYFDGPMSRQALGTATGLSSGSISTITAELVAEGLIEEAGTVGSDGGRPRNLLRVRAGCAYLVGVDVGETRVRVELFDLDLTELARCEHPLERDGHDVDTVVRHISEGVADVLGQASIPLELLLGVGVGVPGIVERRSPDGALVHGQTIGWDAIPLEAMLRGTAGLPEETPFFIENGAQTLGRAEMWFGGGRGTADAAIVLFGSGIGACVVTGGTILEGTRSSASEWGHMTVRVGGRRCRCGSRGCLEAYAGAEALVERWREQGAAISPDTDEESAIAALIAAAHPRDPGTAPDPVAAAVLAETAEYLGAGLSNLINLYNPERILLGGWAGLQLAPYLLDEVRRHAVAYSLRYPAERVTIDVGRLGPDAVTVGAATLPLARFFASGGRRSEPAGEAGLTPGQAGWRASLLLRAPASQG
ncbi:ROK family protein [Nonomuraea endophytica]|uniref:ROK family protein n=1 Tax=Nonomuraea endophytica TaxID=714136 RepID=UPI0037C57BF1